MIVVPSRFAGLKIVEDDFVSDREKSVKKTEAISKVQDKSKKQKNKQVNAGKSAQNNDSASTSSHERKNKKKNPSNDQWEEWKVKDQESVDVQYSTDLMQAIKLSTMELSTQNGDVGNPSKSDQPNPHPKVKENGKKNKKNKPLTLGQFNEMCGSGSQIQEGIPSSSIYERSLYVDLDNEVHNEVDKNGIVNKNKQEKPMKEEKGKIEKQVRRIPPSLEEIKQIQLDASLEEKKEEIKSLKKTLEKTEKELQLVKMRNKKLCNIIGHGEMRAKACLLLEMEEVKEVHTELNSEIERLNAQLQQERSRCTCSHKQDKKKKTTFDV